MNRTFRIRLSNGHFAPEHHTPDGGTGLKTILAPARDPHYVAMHQPRAGLALLLDCSVVRHLIPGSAVQESARPFLVCAAPLFEKEWNICTLALIAKVGDPRGFNETGLGSGLTADNDPVDAVQIEI